MKIILSQRLKLQNWTVTKLQKLQKKHLFAGFKGSVLSTVVPSSPFATGPWRTS